MKKTVLLVCLMLCVFCTVPGYSNAEGTFDVTLGWDANTESNLAGYKIYYKAGESGSPYDGTGAVEGNSPIDVGNVTVYTIHGLQIGTMYYFAATAYNDEGAESGYSDEVYTDGVEGVPSVPPDAPGGLGIRQFVVHRADGTEITLNNVDGVITIVKPDGTVITVPIQ